MKLGQKVSSDATNHFATPTKAFVSENKSPTLNFFPEKIISDQKSQLESIDFSLKSVF